MLIDSARASAVTGALLVTMNRDSTAIRARDYPAAQRQSVHFESLHSELRRLLRAAGSAGTSVAAILRSLHVTGALSSAQSATAISAVESTLSRAGVPTAKLGLLAKRALEARETDAFESITSPNG